MGFARRWPGNGLLGTWEGIEEGIELACVEEDGTLRPETLEGETILRATFAEDNSCQLDIKMRFDGRRGLLGIGLRKTV